MSTEATIALLVVIGLCLVMSAFFSSAETSFISLDRLRVLHLVHVGHPKARRLAQRVEHPERTLSTVLLGNNLVNTAAAALATATAVAWLGDQWGVVAATGGITLLLLVFGEFVPKAFASRHAESLAFRYLRPFAIVELALYPFSLLLQWVGRHFVSITGAKVTRQELINEELLRSMISIGHRHGAVEKEEAAMLLKVLGFGDRLVRDVMTPRTEIVWMDGDTTLSSFLEKYHETPLARFPVFKESPDNVVGILHSRDVIRGMHSGEVQPDGQILHLVRPAYFVPETKPLDDLFFEMRSSGAQMAIVADEYGGISGLVTTHQLIEAIVGPLTDEDSSEEDVEELGQGTFQVDGGMQVAEANETLGLGIPDGEFATVAGFVLDRLGHIPKEGESFSHGQMRFTVSEIKGLKIEKVVVKRSQ